MWSVADGSGRDENVVKWGRAAQFDTELWRLFDQSADLFCVVGFDGNFKLVNPAFALARRARLPVELDVTVEARLPEPVEVAAYYVVSEALANAVKHAGATWVEISLERDSDGVVLTIRDDGVGGADPRRGTGLVGLTDRVEALGGSLRVVSRPGHRTQITVGLPIEQSTVEPKPSG